MCLLYICIYVYMYTVFDGLGCAFGNRAWHGCTQEGELQPRRCGFKLLEQVGERHADHATLLRERRRKCRTTNYSLSISSSFVNISSLVTSALVIIIIVSIATCLWALLSKRRPSRCENHIFSLNALTSAATSKCTTKFLLGHGLKSRYR